MDKLTKREEELEIAVWRLPSIDVCINFKNKGYDKFVRRSDVTELFRQIRIKELEGVVDE